MAAVVAGCAPAGGTGHGDGPFDDPPPEEPEVFADGVVSTEAFEWRITFEPDGRTAYFARSEEFFPTSRQATVLVTRWSDGAWSEPEVAPFSGTHPDIDPFVSPDGDTLLFSSIRPVDGEERTDTDLWLVRRTADGGWSEPEHLGDAVNSPADELYASVDEDGTLYFGSDRTGEWDVYRAVPGPDGRLGPAENLGEPVNAPTWDFNPTVTPDGGLLVFTALGRAGGVGAGDLWWSRRDGDGWTEPALVGELVNTGGDQYHPSFTPTLDRLVYVDAGDLVQVATSALDLPEPRSRS